MRRPTVRRRAWAWTWPPSAASRPFLLAGGSKAVTVTSVLTQAALDSLSAGPLTWSDMLTEARRRLTAAKAAGPLNATQVEADVASLGSHGQLRASGEQTERQA